MNNFTWEGGCQGSGTNIEEVRSIAPFSSICLNGPVNVIFRQSNQPILGVSGDDNLIELISTEVINGVLHIGVMRNYQTSAPMVVVCGTRLLAAVTVRSSTAVVIEKIQGQSISLLVQGSGDILIDGKMSELKGTVQGSGRINAVRLVSQNVNLTMMGSGDIHAMSKRSLTATIMGSGNIHVGGHPMAKHITKIGSGNVYVC